MKKITKLIRVPKILRKDKTSFFIEDKDVILNSIKVFAYNISRDEEIEVGVKISINPKSKIEVNISGIIFDSCDYFILKYERIREAIEVTIEAKDCISTNFDPSRGYTFYLNKDLEEA